MGLSRDCRDADRGLGDRWLEGGGELLELLLFVERDLDFELYSVGGILEADAEPAAPLLLDLERLYRSVASSSLLLLLLPRL